MHKLDLEMTNLYECEKQREIDKHKMKKKNIKKKNQENNIVTNDIMLNEGDLDQKINEKYS